MNSWPNVPWRQALHAATDPSGPPVEEIPLLDPNLLYVVSPLNVTLLVNYYPGSNRYTAARIVSRFLENSGHNVDIIPYINNFYQLNASLSNSDAFVIPNLRYYSAKKSPLPYSIESLIRDFTYNGGRTVFAGRKSEFYVNNIFPGSYVFQNEAYSYIATYNYVPGFLIESNYTSDNIFSPFFHSSEILVPFQGEFFTDYNPEHCPYFYNGLENYPNNYCAVWSKHYGLGDITILSNGFYNT